MNLKNWGTKYISDILSLNYGKPLPSELRQETGKHPIYAANGVIGRTNSFLFDKKSIVIGRKGSVGKLRITEDHFWPLDVTYFVKYMESKNDIVFIYYLLLSLNLERLGKGVKPGINRNEIYKIKVNIPSLAEQKRIVAILDEAFAAIAKAKENAEKNLFNAREVFESYLNGVFANPGEGWEEKQFKKICILQRGFDLPKHLRKKGKYPLVSSNGITDQIDTYKVKAPGVVTGRSGTIGNVHYIVEDFWPLNTSLYIKDFCGNNVRFVYYFIKQFNLNKYSSGTGVPTLNRNNVHSEWVYFPKSIIEQSDIATNLDALSVEVTRLESIYHRKSACLNELKKSILGKAFRGELTEGFKGE